MTDRLQSVALGEATADVAVIDGRVALVERGEFQARDVAIVDDRIAAIPKDAEDVIGSETTVINASGHAVLPGLIDAHTHLDLHATVETIYPRLLETGTTTLISETTSFALVCGATGVEALLAAAEYLPITVRGTVPPQPFSNVFEAAVPKAERDELLELVADDRIVGAGEIGWIYVVGQESPIDDLHRRARVAGKRIGGHGAGCTGRNLAAYAGVIDNDHEAIDPDGVEERLEQGIHVIGRCGSIRDDMSAVASAIEYGDAGEVSLSTDGLDPADLLNRGSMDHVVSRAIDEGLALMDAVRAATLHPARQFGLDDRGSIAPGNVADVVIVEDLETMDVRTVLSGGELVVRNGSATVAPRTHSYPDELLAAPDIDLEAITLDADEIDGQRVRAVEIEGELLTGSTTAEPAIVDGRLVSAPDRDVLKAVLWDRREESSSAFAGFLTGLGLDRGAIATTLCWDVAGLLAVGADDDSIRTAASRLADLGGGWVVVRDGDTVAELPARIGGRCSDLDLEETARLYRAVEDAARSIGCDVARPLLTLQTLTFAGVPALKFGPEGYRDVFERRVVRDLSVSE